MSYKTNPLCGKHFQTAEGFHEVKSEISTGFFLVESTSRKGEHKSQKIWRVVDIHPHRLHLTFDDLLQVQP
jgi:hypothetical protein